MSASARLGHHVRFQLTGLNVIVVCVFRDNFVVFIRACGETHSDLRDEHTRANSGACCALSGDKIEDLRSRAGERCCTCVDSFHVERETEFLLSRSESENRAFRASRHAHVFKTEVRVCAGVWVCEAGHCGDVVDFWGGTEFDTHRTIVEAETLGC